MQYTGVLCARCSVAIAVTANATVIDRHTSTLQDGAKDSQVNM